MCACACERVRARVHARVHARVRAYVRVHVCVCVDVCLFAPRFFLARYHPDQVMLLILTNEFCR